MIRSHYAEPGALEFFVAKIGCKRPLNQKQNWAIRFVTNREKHIRNRALFDLAIDTKLKGYDLAELKIGEPFAPLLSCNAPSRSNRQSFRNG